MIIFRYILREFFKLVFSTLMLCLFLFIVFDFIHKTTTYFSRYHPPVSLILKYYAFQMPFEVYQVLPIAALIASVAIMMVMNRTGEIVALRAAGMSPIAIATPLAAGGLLLTLLSFVFGEFIIPHTSKKMRYITFVQIEGEKEVGLNVEAHWVKGEHEALSFKNYEPSTRTLQGVKLIKLSPDFKPVEAIHAELAVFIEKPNVWKLTGVKILSFDAEKGLSQLQSNSELTIPLPVEPEKLVIDHRIPDEMSLSELGDLISSGMKTGADVMSLRVAWHTKIAYPFAPFFLSFVGLRFAYRFERSSETLKRILVVVAFGMSYWFVLSAGRALSAAGDLHPFIAGWLANFWMAAVIMLQIKKLQKV